MKSIILVILFFCAISGVSVKNKIVPPKYYFAICTTINSSTAKYKKSIITTYMRAKSIQEARIIINRIIKTQNLSLDKNVEPNPFIEEIDFEKVKTINNTK